MCKALEDWAAEREAIGEEKGKAKGRLEVLADLVKNGIITASQVAEQAKMSVMSQNSLIKKADVV